VSLLSNELKLKPRLVPKPLWWLSLAGLARMDPYILDLIGLQDYSVIEQWSRIWFEEIRKDMLSKHDVCEICKVNKPKIIDEDWEYTIKEDKGVARLIGLRAICDLCNLVVHFGYACTQGKEKIAFSWFKKINKVPSELAKETIKNAFRIWKIQSEIKNWCFSLDYIRKLYPEIGEKLEVILNKLYELKMNNFDFDSSFLWCMHPVPLERKQIIINLSKHPMELAKDIINECKSYNVNYDEQSLLVAVYLLYLWTIKRKNPDLFINIMQQYKLPSLMARVKIGSEEKATPVTIRERSILSILASKGDISTLDKIYKRLKENLDTKEINVRGLTNGKWMFFLDSNEAFRTFKKLADEIISGKLISRIAKISIKRKNESRQVTCVYLNNFMDIGSISTLRDQLREIGVKAYLMFKPDIFTMFGIYKGAGIRPYIYWDKSTEIY